MDMRLFRPYVYDEVAVNRYFDAKGQDASRRLFAIMLGDTVVGELQLKQIDHDKKECTLSIHMQNDAVKGKGYGTQAERLAVKIAFDELGMAAVNADKTTFGTANAVTWEQAVTMLWRFAKTQGFDTTQGGMAIREYDDYDSLSEYVREAMAWAVNTKLSRVPITTCCRMPPAPAPSL